MTKAEEKIYQVIDNFIKENKYSPSIREICDLLGGRNVATVFVHLKKMRNKGYINYIDGKNRTIVIL